MTEVTSLFRRAEIGDYSEIKPGLFHLTWQPRMLAGVLCNDPVEDVRDYNDFIDNPQRQAESDALNRDNIQTIYKYCQSNKGQAAGRCLTLMMLNCLDSTQYPLPDSYQTMTQALTDNEQSMLLDLFFSANNLQTLLDSAQILKLTSTSLKSV